MSRILDRLLVLVAIAVSAIAIVNYADSRRSPPSSDSRIGELRGTALPHMTVRLLDSTLPPMVVPVPDQPTLFYLMSTTCAACARNEERWEALKDSVRGMAAVVAVSIENATLLRNYWAAREPDYPVGMLAIEGQDSIIEAFRMHATPTLYLLDSSGVLRDSWVGVFADSINRRITNAVRAINGRQ